MPTIQHSVLGSGELHEPKGASGASSNETYVSDGAGSGTWKEPEPKGTSAATAGEIYQADGAGSGSWVTAYTMGWEDFNDTGSSQGLTTSYVDLTNDGAGSFTNTTYQIPGYGPMWDVAADEFDWAAGGLALGDTVEIRIDLDITTTGANREIFVAMDLAHGHANEYQLKIFSKNFKTAATYSGEVILARVYMGDTDTLNNPAKIVCKSDGAGDSVVVNGWFTTYTPYSLSRS